MISRWNLNTIRVKIVVYFSVIFLFVLSILGIVTYRFMSDKLTTEIYAYTQKIIDEKRISMDTYFNQIKSLVELVAANSNTIGLVREQSSDNYERKLYYSRETVSLMQNVFNFNPQIKEIGILNKDGQIIEGVGKAINRSYNFYNQPWFENKKYPLFKVEFIGVHPQDYYLYAEDGASARNQKMISAVAPVVDFFKPSEAMNSMVLFNLKVDNLDALLNKPTLEKTGTLFILDHDNKAVNPVPSHFKSSLQEIQKLKFENEEGRMTVKIQNKEYAVAYQTSNVTGWKIAAFIPMDEIFSHMSPIQKIIIVTIIIALILVLLTSILLSSKITKPLMTLMQKMKRIEQGQLHVVLYDASGTEEVKQLSQRIDNMIQSIQQLNQDVYSYRLISKNMELKALQNQINPHFLYNTLQSLKALAVLGRTKDISNMVTQIGLMLRYAINNMQEVVTIKQELDHVRSYLEIQNFRYPNQFTSEISCDEELLGEPCLKFTLQPIVENIYSHAFEHRNQGCFKIEIHPCSQGIQIEISDDGVGIPLEKLEDIRRELLDHVEGDYDGGVGLSNVHQRLIRKYGDQYGVLIESVLNIGTTITIIFPRGDGIDHESSIG
ncbi:sensor histidine kinase [Paenibacillus sp. GCM10027629]|uniref:cache domain-containing sensor histidine kinase n=1 Tax=Paenibacillus sp. GCM10027629 TaxID=3273414 RepID=UPI003630EFC0